VIQGEPPTHSIFSLSLTQPPCVYFKAKDEEKMLLDMERISTEIDDINQAMEELQQKLANTKLTGDEKRQFTQNLTSLALQMQAKESELNAIALQIGEGEDVFKEEKETVKGMLDDPSLEMGSQNWMKSVSFICKIRCFK
jgi:phosphopantetheinyl transferase (holo-ACP synthase)